VSVVHRWRTAAPWIQAWPNPARGRAVRSGAFRWRVRVLDSLHDGPRALLVGTLPVLPSVGRVQPHCCHRREDSISTFVTDVSI
jgi:hypothetical protein